MTVMQLDLVELREEIHARPWRAVAVAFAAGACFALTGSRRPGVRAIAAAVSGALLDVVRESVKARVAAS
jgi:hypothetical protein